MTNNPFDSDDPAVLLDMLVALNENIENITEELKPVDVAKCELEAYEIEARRAYEAAAEIYNAERVKLRDLKKEVDLKAYDDRKALEAAKVRRDQIERKLAQAKQLIEAEEKLEAERLRFLNVTLGAPWREFAAEHQIYGATRMAVAERFILADTMGLGKTLTSIAALDMLAARGEGKKVLYFTPAPALTNVVQEFEKKWAPHRKVVPFGGQTKVMRRLLIDKFIKPNDECVVVVNYEFARKDNSIIGELMECGFDTIIGDEAHIIKETESLAYKQFNSLARNIKNVFLMTGTPILNKPEELFALLSIVKPKMFYNKKYFLQDYCVFDWDRKKHTFAVGGLDSLTKKIADIYLRRTKESAGIVLPPQTIQDHFLEPDPEKYPAQWRAYQEMKDFYVLWYDKDNGKGISAVVEIAMITRLRQILTAPSGIAQKDPDGNVVFKIDIEESQKIDYILPVEDSPVDDADNGLLRELLGGNEKVAIYSQFKEPLEILHKRCIAAGIRSIVLDGGTPDIVRNEIKQQMDASRTPFDDCKYDVVLCNHKVGGVALNFTNVSQMIILDEEWNPGKNEQTYGRMDRMGQERPNTVHIIQMDRTIDTWMRKLNEDKKAMIEGFDTVMEYNKGAFLKGLKDGEF